MITFPPETFTDLNELGYAIGLKSFDPALPQQWVDSMLEQTKLIAGKPIYPRGFVWCYDKSLFGEPVPLTEGARVYAKFMAISPRVYEGTKW